MPKHHRHVGKQESAFVELFFEMTRTGKVGQWEFLIAPILIN